MGEIGVIFLMFFIGLELSGEMLKKIGSLLFGGGALQVGLTIALVTGIGVVFGVNAVAYADQNERDHATFRAAIDSGRIAAHE